MSLKEYESLLVFSVLFSYYTPLQRSVQSYFCEAIYKACFSFSFLFVLLIKFAVITNTWDNPRLIFLFPLK